MSVQPRRARGRDGRRRPVPGAGEAEDPERVDAAWEFRAEVVRLALLRRDGASR